MNRSALSRVGLLSVALLAGPACQRTEEQSPAGPRAPRAKPSQAQAQPPAEASDVGFFTPAPPMLVPRSGHTATLLQDGRVLVTGGYGRGYMDTAELWDPGTSRWLKFPSMKGTRAYHATILLPDGRIMVLGGSSFDAGDRNPCGGSFRRTELWSFRTETWSQGPCLNYQLPTNDSSDPAVALLPDGQLFASTEANDIFHPSYVELWSPTTERWRVVKEFKRRENFTLTLLTDGRVLMAGGHHTGTGGQGEATAQLWEPRQEDWLPTGPLPLGRSRAKSVRLKDGRVLVVGGHAARGFAAPGAGPRNVMVFEPASGTWRYAAPLTPAPETQHRMVLLPSGSVLLFNGGQAFVWNPGQDRWSPAGKVAQPRTGFTLTSLGDGRALVCGGSFGESYGLCDLWQPKD